MPLGVQGYAVVLMERTLHTLPSLVCSRLGDSDALVRRAALDAGRKLCVQKEIALHRPCFGFRRLPHAWQPCMCSL